MIKKILQSFKDLTKFEVALWVFSLLTISVSFIFLQDKNYLTLIASLIGVTALIFVAKGYVLGQILIVIFSVLYGIVSYATAYYGEMITYLGMSAPVAIFTIISWLKHPYKGTKEVELGKLTLKHSIFMIFLCAIVTFAFYFILKAFNTANLIISTVSVFTSFLACYLLFVRIPYYALAYALNDIVLIILWILASIESLGYLPMVICFGVFLLNDIYGFISWQRMKIKQSKNEI
ncbi:MAG: nicotinamide mononucleotide transporter [Clostridiales bacterium]|nr:nicotinamide mononucleotide transporter [Clostridiales bacterium]